MSFEMLFRWAHEFGSYHLETLLLKAFDDFVNESTLNTVGFRHDESAFFTWVLCHLLNYINYENSIYCPPTRKNDT